jgi:nucleotide-binding universal stress UspA family protein
MTTILVPTDFSKTSQNGLDLAVDMAENIDGKIILLNVIYPPRGSGFTAMGDVETALEGEAAHFMAELVRKNKERLNAEIDKYKDRSVEIIPQLDFEDKVQGLNAFVKEHQIDLIVIGTKGRKSLTEYLLGSHTENLIKVSDCPVISTKEKVEDFSLDNIVLAIDIRDKNFDGFGKLKLLLGEFKSKVHFLYVMDDGVDTDEAIDELRQIAEKNGFSDYTINTVDNNNPEDAIKRYVNRRSADMLAVFSHGKKGIKELIFGSVTNALINNVSIPVFVMNFDD